MTTRTRGGRRETSPSCRAEHCSWRPGRLFFGRARCTRLVLRTMEDLITFAIATPTVAHPTEAMAIYAGMAAEPCLGIDCPGTSAR